MSTNSVSVNSDEYNNGNEDSDSSGSDSKGYDDVDGEGYDDKFDSDSGLSFSYGDGEGSNEKDDGLKFSIVTKSPKGSGGSTLSGSGGSTLSKTTNILSFVPPVARGVLKKDEKIFQDNVQRSWSTECGRKVVKDNCKQEKKVSELNTGKMLLDCGKKSCLHILKVNAGCREEESGKGFLEKVSKQNACNRILFHLDRSSFILEIIPGCNGLSWEKELHC